MKMVILAAGEGRRLRPFTEDKPKSMVKYKNKALIDYILEASDFIDEKAIVGGYKIDILKEYLKNKKIKIYENKNFATTNMVYTLMCAKDFFDDDTIVSYADIIYPKSFIDKLLKSQGEIVVLADKNWLQLWERRFDNVLDDCETFKYDKYKNLYEIGNKSNSIEDTMAGYIGLIKFSKKVLWYISNMELDEKLYMTDLLSLLLKKFKIKVELVEDEWLEIDTKKDLVTNVNI